MMETRDILTVIAIIVGPVAAVLVTYFAEQHREAVRRRLWVFRSLVGTRGRPLASEHVQALNMIDFDFGEGKFSKVRAAWDYYRKHLNTNQDAAPDWVKTGEERLNQLLVTMGNALGYPIDINSLTASYYLPVGHGTAARDEEAIGHGWAEILGGEKPLRVLNITESDVLAGTPTKDLIGAKK